MISDLPKTVISKIIETIRFRGWSEVECFFLASGDCTEIIHVE